MLTPKALFRSLSVKLGLFTILSLTLFAAVAVATSATGARLAFVDDVREFFGERSSTADLRNVAELQPAAPAAMFFLTCTSTATGNWSDTTKWTGCGGGTPGSGDAVVIASSHT